MRPQNSHRPAFRLKVTLIVHQPHIEIRVVLDQVSQDSSGELRSTEDGDYDASSHAALTGVIRLKHEHFSATILVSITAHPVLYQSRVGLLEPHLFPFLRPSFERPQGVRASAKSQDARFVRLAGMGPLPSDLRLPLGGWVHGLLATRRMPDKARL